MPAPAAEPRRAGDARLIDLSHLIEDGMTTYPGIPPPQVCDFLSREASGTRYAPGTTFQIGRIDLVANTGTYLDSPFHRFADGRDISQLTLGELADLPAAVVRAAGGRAIDAAAFAGLDLEGRAVLVLNIDDIEDGERPVHTTLLGAGIPCGPSRASS